MSDGTSTERRLAVVLVGLLLFQAVAPMPAAAQSDDEPLFDGVIADDESLTGSILSAATEATGSLARLQEGAKERAGLSESSNVSDNADAAAAAIEADNETIREYANPRLAFTSDYDTFAVHFHDRDGNTATRYIATDVTDGNWSAGPAVLTPEQFNATGRTADHWVALDWFASKHAAKEIGTFVDDFAQEGENVSSTRRASLLSKYGSGIKSDMWGDESPTFEE